MCYYDLKKNKPLKQRGINSNAASLRQHAADYFPRKTRHSGVYSLQIILLIITRTYTTGENGKGSAH